MSTDQSVVLAACGRKIVGANPVQIDQSEQADVANGLSPGKEIIERCLRTYRNLIGEPVAVMFRQEVKSTGFNVQYHSLGDLDLWLRILAHGNFYLVGEELVGFRHHKHSETNRLLGEMDWVLDFFKSSSRLRPLP